MNTTRPNRAASTFHPNLCSTTMNAHFKFEALQPIRYLLSRFTVLIERRLNTPRLFIAREPGCA